MVVGHLKFLYDVSLTQERCHLHIELSLTLSDAFVGNEWEGLTYLLTSFVINTSERSTIIVSHYIDNAELVVAIVLKRVSCCISFTFSTTKQPADKRHIESLWRSTASASTVLRCEDWCGFFLSVDHNVNLVRQSLSDKLTLFVGRVKLKQATGLVWRKESHVTSSLVRVGGKGHLLSVDKSNGVAEQARHNVRVGHNAINELILRSVVCIESSSLSIGKLPVSDVANAQDARSLEHVNLFPEVVNERLYASLYVVAIDLASQVFQQRVQRHRIVPVDTASVVAVLIDLSLGDTHPARHRVDEYTRLRERSEALDKLHLVHLLSRRL